MPPRARTSSMRPPLVPRLAQEEKKASHVAHWQVRSDQKMKSLNVQRRLEALNLRREADLNARRERLAQLLYSEDLALKQELVSGKETPEQRRAKLANRARDLATKREAERQALAAQLYEQAFQENCDVLRETNSKRILYRTLDERNAQVRGRDARERAHGRIDRAGGPQQCCCCCCCSPCGVQIEQRLAQRIAEEEEKRAYTEMNEAQRIKAEQRYLDDKRKQKELQTATVKVLDEQVRADKGCHAVPTQAAATRQPYLTRTRPRRSVVRRCAPWSSAARTRRRTAGTRSPSSRRSGSACRTRRRRPSAPSASASTS